MITESSIKETLISTTTEPITDMDAIIDAICRWNWIPLNEFKDKVWNYYLFGKDNNWNQIYVNDAEHIVNPVGMYLRNAYQWKFVVFEKWNDKFFGTLKVSSANNIRYQLWDTVIEIPFRIMAVNDDTQEWITIFPKLSDFIQPRMKSLYVVNTWWAERQRLEKEIMAKLIELAKVRGWNEIISTQNLVEELQQSLKKKGIDLILWDGAIVLEFPWRKIRDVANHDNEYMAPPITIQIDFEARLVECKWYSSHWFGTPTSRWSPCWWNWDNNIRDALRNCDLRGLINLIISWSYGYNSQDTWLSHSWRHPLGKLRDYVWYLHDHRNELSEVVKQKFKENLQQIKTDLNIDNWLDECQDIRNFISTLEWDETAN